jgi:predicted MFS family arabinose efflux permease
MNKGGPDPLSQRDPTPSLWRHADFMRLWFGQTVSEMGSRITRDGLPLLAVITLGATPVQMGFLSAISSLPVLLISLFAGVWIDRLRRKPLMIWSDLGRAVLLATIPAAALMHVLGMGQLYLVAVGMGILALFFDVAYQSYLPSLVTRAHVLEGNSKLTLSASFAELAGPGLAGVLVQALTAPVAILLDALSFLASVGSLLLIRKPEEPPAATQERKPVGAELYEGVQMLWGHPVLRAFALATTTRRFFGEMIGVLYTLYAIRYLGLGPALLGFAIAFGGVSDILGSLFAARLIRWLGTGATLLGAFTLSALSILLIPLAHGPVWAAAGFLIASQLFGDGFYTVFLINEVSLRQVVTPDRLLGRTNAGLQLLQGGIGPLGAIAAGVLAQSTSVRTTLFVAACGSILAAGWLILSPIRKMT